MDYEKKYKEALDRAKEFHKSKEGIYVLVAETIFPELAESEDERIRKALIEVFKEKLERGFEWVEYGIPNRSVLSWLEKQKEQNGEDEECTDFTIYHPLKNGKGEYECIPYSFYGSLTSFSEDKDLIDFLRTCFYTKEECEEWIKKQKEQEPVERWQYVGEVDLKKEKEQNQNIELIQRSWYMEGYHDRKFNKEPKWIIKTGEGGPRYEENPKYGQIIEQKPAEWVLPEDFEEAVYKVANFISPFDNQEELRKASHRFAEQLLSLAKKELDKPTEKTRTSSPWLKLLVWSQSSIVK